MTLEELADHITITEVLTRYARAVDHQDFPLARTCYHDDATDDHGRYKGDVEGLFAFFEELAGTLARTFHMLGAPHVVLRGNRAWCETYCLYRREAVASSPHGVVQQGLRYLDLLEKRDGEWRIATRQVVLDWEQQGTDAPAIPSGPTWSRGEFGAADPSVAFFTAAQQTST